MKKTLLTAGVLSLLSVSLFGQRVANKTNVYNAQSTAQEPEQQQYIGRACGTPAVTCQEWEDWLQAKVVEYKQSLEAQKTTSVLTYTIPVVVHVINNGENVGIGTNLSQTQINSQITVLNNDYAGTGFNVANVPSTFSSLVSNTGISFCLAQKDPSGNILAEPGIHRVNRNTMGWSTPPFTQSYIDNTIKPATIWNPNNYLNVWVCNISGSILGYATFPAASGLTCLSSPFGTNQNDGVVILYNAFGNTGNVAAPYNKGRTATHEVGHWLGLRHIWGDNTCGSDCVADTPPAQTANFNCISGCTNGCFTHPHNLGGCSGNTTGEMTMNFMDYTDDACMYMFTPDQTTRMQTCLANGTYRSTLTAASATVCNSTPVSPTAGFTFPGGIHCTGTAYTFTDASTGGPTSWSWSVSPSTGVTVNTATSQSPQITFANAGTYSVTLTATNAQGSDADVQTITIQTCGGTCDTLANFDFANDTPTLYGSGGTGAYGYVAGHNNYQDKAKADFFAGGSYPTGYRISSAFYYFGKNYDAGTAGSINCKVWNDNGTAGAPSTAFTPSVPLTLATMDITGAGNQITFSPMIDPANGGFYVGFDGLTYGANQDTVAILTNADLESTPATAWEQWSDNTWHSFNDGTTNTWQLDLSLAIAVVLCDPTVGTPYIINPTSNVIVYPNPANNMVYVNANSKKEGTFTIKLYNVMGQAVATKVIEKSTGGTFDLDLNNFGSGVYFISVSTPEKSVTKKIVIEK